MINPREISESRGNVKMGRVRSVSLPPVTTCPRGVPCGKKCYARGMYNRFPLTRAAWDRNLEIYRRDPESYFSQIAEKAARRDFFRWHVSGDIPDRAYLIGMIRVARACPNTVFLCFTKRYEWINDYLDSGWPLPSNLRVIFSAWGDGWEVPNPHGLPVAHVVFAGDSPDPRWHVCGGNCRVCADSGVGCWYLKNGDSVCFYEHGAHVKKHKKRGKKA